jgi:hypothetical protein
MSDNRGRWNWKTSLASFLAGFVAGRVTKHPPQPRGETRSSILPPTLSVSRHPEGSASPSIPRQRLLDLHIAEYQALTTRCTYWIALHYALWPILLLSLTLAAQLHGWLAQRAVLWGSVIAVQVTLIAYYTSMLEHYAAVHYIEQRLRPLVEAAIGTQTFWQYEAYVNSNRPRGPAWWEYSPLGVAMLALVAVQYYARWTWEAADWLSYLAAAGCALLVYKSAVRASGLRRAFFVTA